MPFASDAFRLPQQEKFTMLSNPPTPTAESTPEIEAFRPGVYRHYKGNCYLALGVARADETDEPVVVYTRLYPREGLPMSTRLLRIWNESVMTDDGPVPRFTYVGHTTPAV